MSDGLWASSFAKSERRLGVQGLGGVRQIDISGAYMLWIWVDGELQGHTNKLQVGGISRISSYSLAIYCKSVWFTVIYKVAISDTDPAWAAVQ